ncbi:hypothetical protein MAPG_10504 [Magnaporthiopsis poae ATCC 64411]|uniref:PD-(D/E)XK nuclease-like domain-containing protein n=1 Tax=Magnaporthiopsis poae (strain ATCC 64411 / 73-15) TaxID=644358 RepID=A0A0C4ECR9_MAGP6|nr:hypothetical protein MAPG_10504 [Magnaporthiopsis poae ATCC 64411]
MAQRSMKQKRGEPAWNSLVHCPLLQLAARFFFRGGVICEPVMSAGIASQWLPEMAGKPMAAANKGAVAGGKMVDFVLALDLNNPRPRDQELADVTKITAAQTEGTLQLDIWTAVWHRRMRDLGYTDRLINLPLVLCRGHGWSLYFACDRGHKIDIVGPASGSRAPCATGGSPSLAEMPLPSSPDPLPYPLSPRLAKTQRPSKVDRAMNHRRREALRFEKLS